MRYIRFICFLFMECGGNREGKGVQLYFAFTLDPWVPYPGVTGGGDKHHLSVSLSLSILSIN